MKHLSLNFKYTRLKNRAGPPDGEAGIFFACEKLKSAQSACPACWYNSKRG